MKNYLLLLFIPFYLLTNTINAQEIETTWSSRQHFSNKKEGYLDGFVGSNDQFVYGVMKDLEARFMRKNRNKFELSLVAFDKNNMQIKYHFYLKNKKKNKANYEKKTQLTYINSVVADNSVYVFWKKSTVAQSIIYVETFDNYLNQVGKIQKIYTIKHESAKKRKFKNKKRNKEGLKDPVPIVVQLSKDKKSLMIGAEMQLGKKEAFEFDYVILDLNFSEVYKGHVELPVIQTTASFLLNTTSLFTYKYGEDGKIYIKGNVKLNKSEREGIKKSDNMAFSMLNVVDPVTNDLATFSMKYEGMNIYNFDFISDENGIKMYGFFSDLSKSNKTDIAHGIFYAQIQNNEMSEPTFTYFDEKTLTDLFRGDPSDTRENLSKRAKKSNVLINKLESLDESYEIEAAKSPDTDHIVLFCTKVYNYSVQSCSNNGSSVSCETRYYCKKSNVTTFKLNQEGEIIWSSNIDRQKTYSGWDVKDIKVINDAENLYVYYGSAYKTDAKRLFSKRKKRMKEIRDEFEYAVIDYETGKTEKMNYVVNAPGVKKRDRKYVSTTDIQEIDNTLFLNSTRLKIRPILYVLPVALFVTVPLAILIESPILIATSLISSTALFATIPAGFYVLPRGLHLKGDGHFGTIRLKK